MTLLPMPFSNPHTYKGHSGVDYPGHAGEYIRASGPGVITTRSRNERGGYYVWVQYDSGPRVGYHHMNGHESTPPPGRRVAEGSIIGIVGWTGNVRPAGRAGAHLHSEVYGHATTDGYWRFFDRNRVVGQPTPAAHNNQEEDTMILCIKGKTGERRGGLYLVQGDQATFIGARRVSAYPLFSNEDEIKILQSRIKGLR